MEFSDRILICIPTYNERNNIFTLYEAIKTTGVACDLLFCDDNSPDGTGAVIDEIVSNDASVYVLHRAGKLGLGTAQRDSLEYARIHKYDYAIIMDADLTHNPAFIKDLIEKKANADVVIGSRYIRGASMNGWGNIRLYFTNLWRSLIRHGLGLSYDATGAFRLYRLAIFTDEIHKKIRSREFAYGLELLYRLDEKKARILETPIKADQRVHGASKLSGKIMREMAVLYCRLVAERCMKRFIQ